MLKVGDCLRVQTKTLQDVFGVCYYEIEETNIEAPEPDRKGEMDGIKARMLGGSGPSAREGIVIHDSQHRIDIDIAAGIIEVMDKDKAMALLSDTPKPTGVGEIARPATGVVEMD